MQILSTPEHMVRWAEGERAHGQRIGLVPTMGALHAGHTSLMAALRPRVDRLVASIYVNPLQFGAGEDLDRYPRDPEGDAEKCRAAGVDALFSPADLYPDGFRTAVSVHGLTDGLCGASRPGHFDGVTTVVARLFGLVRCDEAIFGEKDYQQLAVIRQMVRDLAMPVKILGGALIRDEDGLALSSRNKYLSPALRQRARSLHQALQQMVDAERGGERRVAELRSLGWGRLDADRLDYLEVVDAASLQPLTEVVGPARVLVAAYYGSTRLIDNMALGPEPQWT